MTPVDTENWGKKEAEKGFELWKGIGKRLRPSLGRLQATDLLKTLERVGLRERILQETT